MVSKRFGDRLKQALKEAIEMQPRWEFLCSHVPHCPKCGAEQVQLMVMRPDTAYWKCRECKHSWQEEPCAKDSN